jgi:hypothetical protein
VSAYHYWGNCSQSTAEDIWDLQDSAEPVSWRTFKKVIPEARKMLEEMGAVWDETTEKQIEDSQFLDFYKGTFMGLPAYFIDWSRIEWIWVKAEENPEQSIVLSKLGRFETGRPVKFRYMRSTERAPFLGSRFGQDIEPAGRYLLEDDHGAHEHPQDGWEYGWVEFDSPLVIPFTAAPDEPHYGPAGWKATLSRAYGGKTGRALTKAIRADGYDSIVTVWLQGGRPSYTKEIVDLGVVSNPLTADVSGALGVAAIAFLMTALGLTIRALRMKKRRDPGPGRTAAVGNSITAARSGFVSFLDRSLPSRSFANMGVVGEGSVAIKRRLERNVIGQGFDEVIIEAGINDIRGRNAVEHISSQLQSMVRTAKQAGLKVVLTNLPPWHQEVGKIAAVNDRIRAQGRNWGADVVVDIHRPLADWRGHLRQELVGDRMGLHPNREGQELIGRTILEAAYS